MPNFGTEDYYDYDYNPEIGLNPRSGSSYYGSSCVYPEDCRHDKINNKKFGGKINPRVEKRYYAHNHDDGDGWGPCKECDDYNKEKARVDRYNAKLALREMHFAGSCKVEKTTNKAILCRFEENKEDKESKYSLSWSRWVPRSQVLQVKIENKKTIGKYADKGDEGELWVSSFLKRKLDLEIAKMKSVDKMSDEELSKVSAQIHFEQNKRQQEVSRKKFEEEIHYAGVNTEFYDSVTTGAFIIIPIETLAMGEGFGEHDKITPDIRPDLKELGLSYIPFPEELDDLINDGNFPGWIIPIKEFHSSNHRSDFYGGIIYEMEPTALQKALEEADKYKDFIKKYNGKVFFGGVSSVQDW